MSDNPTSGQILTHRSESSPAPQFAGCRIPCSPLIRAFTQPLTLRHCYATDLLEAGVELPVIQRRLGHNSIRSTMRYLHLANDKTAATPSPLDLLEFPRNARA